MILKKMKQIIFFIFGIIIEKFVFFFIVEKKIINNTFYDSKLKTINKF